MLTAQSPTALDPAIFDQQARPEHAGHVGPAAAGSDHSGARLGESLVSAACSRRSGSGRSGGPNWRWSAPRVGEARQAFVRRRRAACPEPASNITFLGRDSVEANRAACAVARRRKVAGVAGTTEAFATVSRRRRVAAGEHDSCNGDHDQHSHSVTMTTVREERLRGGFFLFAHGSSRMAWRPTLVAAMKHASPSSARRPATPNGCSAQAVDDSWDGNDALDLRLRLR